MNDLEQEFAEVSLDVDAFERAYSRVIHYNPDHELARELELLAAAAGDRREELRIKLANWSGSSDILG
ncbi:hypothetical protein AB4Z38_24515 [Arthrobacter sp. 2RAF6]|uniref:hypothetical protein n=1 Tax=Arthrobacter sp. 2RAF6 TaxID=3233002 RepID=UPI003F932E62